METNVNITNEPQHDAKLPVSSTATYCFAVTGTFHGSLVEASTEGEARRLFHQRYNGESIVHVVKRNWWHLLG